MANRPTATTKDAKGNTKERETEEKEEQHPKREGSVERFPVNFSTNPDAAVDNVP